MQNSIYDNAVLIAGPHNIGCHYFKSLISNTFIIGDGKSAIMNATGHGEYSDGMQTLKRMSDFTSKATKTLIIIYAHGKIDSSGDHIVEFGLNALVLATYELFYNIANTFNKPVDILFIPCHGGGAVKDTDLLPLGSKFIAFSSADKATFPSLIEETIKHFPPDVTFSLTTLYDRYLLNLHSKLSTVFVEVGGSVVDPYTSSQKYLSKQLHNAAQQHVADRLATLCDEEEKCLQKIATIFTKITQVTKLDELLPTYKAHTLFKYFGSMFDSFNNSTFSNEDYNTLEQSPAFLIQIKATLDKLFDKYKIPISVNLDVLAESFTDEDSTDEDNLDEDNIDEYWNDYQLYESCLNAPIFTANNKFPAPEEPVYGMALLAIKYLDEYCLQHDCLVNNPIEILHP